VIQSKSLKQLDKGIGKIMNPSIKETISSALDNLRAEANFPLIRFAKKHLDIDMEKALKEDIVSWAKKYMLFNSDQKLANRVLSSLDSAIAYIQNVIAKSNPKLANNFFNSIKDKYAKMIVDKYMAKNKATFLTKTIAFAKSNLPNKIYKKFDKQNIRLNKNDFNNLKNILNVLVNNIEDPIKTRANITLLKNFLKTQPVNVQTIILEKMMQRKSIKEDLLKRFTITSPAGLTADFQSKINANALNEIKKTQAQEIYTYDGFIERYLPASVRGLHDVDRKVVEQIALQGDNAKPEDLFNFELASRARPNETYQVGHTGPSNRSSTTLANIAMYFASNHGLKRGAPKTMWVMIYESTKGINTTELVDKSVKWTECEFATTQLKPSRFLGAVQFALDPSKSDDKNIAFKAVAGFVSPRVHQGNYNKSGIEGNIKQFLDIAQYYDKPATTKKPELEFKLPKNKNQVSADRTLFQRFVDKLGLSDKKEVYLKEREAQKQFVQAETPQEKAKRLAEEKKKLAFWQGFSEKIQKEGKDAKTWLPTCQRLLKEMKSEQRAVVEKELKNMLKRPKASRAA
jgi:hypothetical protein